MTSSRPPVEVARTAPGSALTQRAVTLGLLAIVGLALLVRLLHFVAIARTAFPDIPRAFPNSDMHAFLRWAEMILAGDVLGRDTYHPYNDWMGEIAPIEDWYRWWGGKEIFQQTPLYAYWVAALLGISGGSLRVVLLVQLVLGALQPLVMFALARRLFDARAGLVAAALTALYGPFVFHQGTMLRDWLPPLLELLAVWLLLRARATDRRADWALAGATTGVAFLAKESILLFLLLALLWVLWESRVRLTTAVVPAACVLAGFLVAVSPLVVRNALVGAPLLAASNRAAEGIIIGNAADAYPIASVIPPSVGVILRRTDGRLPAVARETLATYQGHWGAFLAMLLLKARALVDPLETPNNLSFQYSLEISPVLHITLRYGAILPLGLAGVALVLDRWRRHLLLALYGLTVVGGLLATGVLGRYRLSLVAVLVVYAAAGAVRAFDALHARQVGPAVVFVGLVAAAAAIQQFVAPIPRLREDPGMGFIYAPEYHVAASIYTKEGRWDRAVDEMTRLRLRIDRHQVSAGYRQAAATAAVVEGDYRAGWARHLLEQQRPDEARRQVEEVERLYARRPEDSRMHYNLGVLYSKLGDLPRARARFERFLALEPHGDRADRVRALLARRFEAP